MPNKVAQLVQLLRETKRAKRLGTVILFVTSRCNAYCQTCFYHAELNQPGDMTFAQIEKISRTMPRITDLWLSGGEPTLRRDLSDIIDLFVSNNGVDRIIIPTNGLIKSRVYEVVDRALGNNPAIDLYLNIALDGYGETHDRVRGETLVGEQIKQVPPEVLPAMYAHVSKLTKRYGDRMFAADDRSKRVVKNAVYAGAIITHYRTQHANFQQPTAWPFSCTAGETAVVIDYNGDVRACELREKFATLADFDYDFSALWTAHERQVELSAIDGGNAC